ncbi:MAG: hypothetical protein K6G51_07065 [Sphaerochaetaceae bacterium]|nr:hypothetical protein [Sphaerochaetaceae bacterium]
MKRLVLVILAISLLFTACNYDDQGVFEYILAAEPADNRALNVLGSYTDADTNKTGIVFKSKNGLEDFLDGTYYTLDSSSAAKSTNRDTCSLVLYNSKYYIIYITQNTNTGDLTSPINGLYVHDLTEGTTTAASSGSLSDLQSLEGSPLFSYENIIYFKVTDSSTALTYLMSYTISLSDDTTVTFTPLETISYVSSSYGFYDVDDNVLTFANSSSNKMYVALDKYGKVSSTLIKPDSNDLPYSGETVTVLAGIVDSSSSTQYVILQNGDYLQIYYSTDGSTFTSIHSREITSSNHLYTYFDDEKYIYYNVSGNASMYKISTSSSTYTDFSKLKNLSIAGYFPYSSSDTSYIILASRDNGFYKLASDLSSFSRY